MKKLKNLIIFVILIIIIIIVALLFFIKNNNDNNQVANQYNEPTENTVQATEARNNLQNVDDIKEYLKVVKYVNQYLGAIDQSSWITRETDQNAIAQFRQEMLQGVIDILSTDYINSNKINTENVMNFVDKINGITYFAPMQMKAISSQDNNVTKYIIYGILENQDYRYMQDLYLIVNIDNNKKVFSVEPQINKNYKSIDDVNLTNSNISLEQNDNNIIYDTNIDNDYICTQYTNYYKYLVLGRTDIAFNLLNQQYREKRFGNYEGFRAYLQENIQQISTLYMTQYNVTNENNKTQYMGRDQYGKIYMFDMNSPTNYTVQLDTYTIPTQYFLDEYSGSDQKKVQMNINKFLLMVNNSDWQNAYNLLNEQYRNNNFANIEEFKQYAKQYFVGATISDITKFDKSGEAYVCTVNLSKESGVSEETFVIKLGQGTDFEMSFTKK